MNAHEPFALALLMAPAEGGNPAIAIFVQLALIFAIFWFLLIRPQKKEQERHRAMIEAIKRGDEVVTSGGIIGTVTDASPDRLTLRTGKSTEVVVDRGRISRSITAERKAEAEKS